MRAAVYYRYGSPAVVEVTELDTPVPADDQVLVRVRAASVNRADLDGLRPRPGFARLFMGVRAPRNQRVGVDLAGVVEAIGSGVSHFRPGDAVFGDLSAHGQGAFADFVCAPERAFERMPAGLSFEQAATLPHSAVLALQGLRLRDGRTIRAGDKVVVVGASGNVGPFAVQIAKSLGAEVTGVCRTSKVDMVRSLGADHVIDHQKLDYTRTGDRYDWILDTDSHHAVLSVRRALRPNGVYVTLGGETGRLLHWLALGALASRISDRWMGLLLWWKPFHAADVTTLREMIAAGRLRSIIDRRYPLSEVVEALRHVDDGRARGKVVITVSEGAGQIPRDGQGALDHRPAIRTVDEATPTGDRPADLSRKTG